jgi:arsenite oxidase small subunit
MNRCKEVVAIGRRRFLAGAGIAAAGAAATQLPVKPAKAAAAAGVNYPSTKLANVRGLKIDEPLEVTYPDADAPGVLLKFGKRVPTGVGPDGDIAGTSSNCCVRARSTCAM